MFVDDEPSILSALRRMLRPKRDVWEMCFEESGAEALERIDQVPIDVIVTDFRMPKMNGGQLLDEVRRRRPEISRIILSGHTDEKDLTTVACVAHQFLIKPCKPAELIAALDRALELRDELVSEPLRRETTGIGALPTPPSILRSLSEALMSAEPGMSRAAELVRRDIGLSTKVLQFVQSSFSTGTGHLPVIEEVVETLGVQTIRSLALASDLENASLELAGPSAVWLTDLNVRAWDIAILARRLAAPGCGDDAFCIGMLLEIGQLVFAVCSTEGHSSYLARRNEPGVSLAELEREIFGITHAQSGAYLLHLWGFPIGVIEAVAKHARPIAGEIQEGLTGAQAAILAHHLVEAESVAMCDSQNDFRIAVAEFGPGAVGQVIASWREERRSERP
jgi:HD-like signal output (HDOD) protein/CheY-like chemotaxis protein